jgi:hypothetical protein
MDSKTHYDPEENETNDKITKSTEHKISSKQQRRNQYKLNNSLRKYQHNQITYIMTTRFNENTWEENESFRRINPQYGCIYPSPQENSSKIPHDAVLFVLEMNNDTNTIMGIGALKNRSLPRRHSVYSDPNYNRYCYIGKYRIDRTEMTEEEERIMKVFDVLCFTGSRHMKRLQGLKAFPTDMLFRCSRIVDLVDFVKNMFKKRQPQPQQSQQPQPHPQQ